MKKTVLSALGLAVALAFSMPALGDAAAATTAAPAAATTNQHRLHHRARPAKKACKVTKNHKCPVKHKKHTAKKAAPKNAY
ncbi:hypothetical protein OOJ09_31145 [Mesorhizobium qingshengii]|uniref:Acid shock protein n=1 Tax=Mesorhizobium qingshengii TaxID=1165689 RepID=A0ABT4R509_9HYPH|nr:hypothetical protein [Mesorhizobium qingshengii]MCZ8548638.1 hypothetical protein [Mesorhizobium qingshengii]